MVSSISLFEIIIVISDPIISFWMGVTVADAAAVNPNGTKTVV